MRIGIYGGTFDPVHYGHLLLAEHCREQCGLDQVWFLPAAVPPHKRGHSVSADDQRIEMLRLAIGGHESFIVNDMEMQRGGVSFTVDTLSLVAQENPDATLFFLMGADSLNEFGTWRQPERICQLAIPVVVRRAGSEVPNLDVLSELVPAERLEEFKRYQVVMPVIELSSTEIRRRAAASESIRYQTPRSVEAYIYETGLYQKSASAQA